MGGYDAMTVDHFRPWSRPEFKHLEKKWTNLYYACRLCNGSKSNKWPTIEQGDLGLRFVDPCEDDPDDHFRITRHPRNGDLCWVRALTPAGQYTKDEIRLNRKQLVDIRRALARQERDAQDAFERVRHQIEALVRDVDARGTTPEIKEVLRSLHNELGRIRRRVDDVCSRRPYLLDDAAA